MGAMAGVLNHSITSVAEALKAKAATPADTTTSAANGSDSSDNSSSSATISANDFLTLLVTEMQNQDPTSDTDPNEYINQLVQVNSLEQLIDINQTLTTDLGSTTSSSSPSSKVAGARPDSAAQAAGVGGVTGAAARLHKTPAENRKGAGIQMVPQSASPPAAQGNLSAPGVNRAAKRVAHALDGRTTTRPTATLSRTK